MLLTKVTCILYEFSLITELMYAMWLEKYLRFSLESALLDHALLLLHHSLIIDRSQHQPPWREQQAT